MGALTRKSCADQHNKEDEENKENVGNDRMGANALLEKQVTTVSHLRAGAFKYWASRGQQEEWKTKMAELDVRAEELSEQIMQRLLSTEEADLPNVFGEKGKTLGQLGLEQKREYVRADVFIAVLKEECGAEFSNLVEFA